MNANIMNFEFSVPYLLVNVLLFDSLDSEKNEPLCNNWSTVTMVIFEKMQIFIELISNIMLLFVSSVRNIV